MKGSFTFFLAIQQIPAARPVIVAASSIWQLYDYEWQETTNGAREGQNPQRGNKTYERKLLYKETKTRNKQFDLI